MHIKILDPNVSIQMNVFIIIGNILTLFQNVPQVIKTYKVKSTRDFSSIFLLMRVFSCLIWGSYSIEIKSLLMLINNLITLSSTIFIGYYKVKEIIYKKDKNGNLIKDKDGSPVVLKTVSKSIVYTLPNQKIKVVFRLDNSGTTNNFVRYMKAFSPNTWTKPVSDSFSTSFPGNINDLGNIGRVVGANQSQGVATLASKTKYSITYAEVSFAKFYGLKVANIGNASGNFVEPNSANVSAFLGEAKIDSNNILSYDYSTKEPGAYPLGIVSYLLADTSGKNKEAVKQWAKYLVSPECVNAKPELGFALITGKFLEFINKQISRL